MKWLSLAFRNLLRNGRRSVTTMLAVSLGYAAINIFGGFTTYMFVSIRESFIHDQGNAHVQIWKKGYLEKGSLEPEKYFLTAEELGAIQEAVSEDPRVKLTAGTMQMTGFVDTGETSAIYIGFASKPSARDTIYESGTILFKDSDPYVGDPITDDTPFKIGITSGMAEKLNIGKDSDVILMAPTLDGQMNAIDAKVAQIIDVPAEILNDRYIYMPLSLAQDLYGTQGAGEVRVLLHDREDTHAVVADLQAALAAKGMDVEVKPWDQLSTMYTRTKKMFDIIFALVFGIIITIVTMSVLNTIGMAVVERTKEIGTLRALGLKRRGVVALFGIESCLLGLIGATLGLALTVGFAGLVDYVKPMWEPPMAARAVIWQIKLVPDYLIPSYVLLILLTFSAAIMPAKRAACQTIVDSLGHV